MSIIGNLTGQLIKSIISKYWNNPTSITNAQIMYNNRPSLDTDPRANPSRNGDSFRGYENYDTDPLIWSDWEKTGVDKCEGYDKYVQLIRRNNKGGSETMWELFESDSIDCGYEPVPDIKVMVNVNIQCTGGRYQNYQLYINNKYINLPANGTVTLNNIDGEYGGDKSYWKIKVVQSGSSTIVGGALGFEPSINYSSTSATEATIFWRENPYFQDGNKFRSFNMFYTFPVS